MADTERLTYGGGVTPFPSTGPVAAMATTTAKQVYYSPPHALLAKRRKSSGVSGHTLTVAIPFAFSTRLARVDRPRVPSSPSSASIRRSRTTSLPKLTSARPSITTSKSTTTNSGSVVKRAAGSGCYDYEASLLSGGAERRSAVETGASEAAAEMAEDLELLSPEEEKERRVNNDKCRRWLQTLPSKFSGMHIVQQTVHSAYR